MNPTTYPILLIGNMLLLALIQGLLPRWIVTGPDKRQLKDVPKLKWYFYGILAAAIVLLIGLLALNLQPYQVDLSALALLLATGVVLMFMEKKYLPHTRRHLVTLCWLGGICLIAGVYAWTTY